jgi:hypothetical protein
MESTLVIPLDEGFIKCIGAGRTVWKNAGCDPDACILRSHGNPYQAIGDRTAQRRWLAGNRASRLAIRHKKGYAA